MATINPRRGDVWRIRFDPAEGAEQEKTRPAIVLSEPKTGRPTVYLCAPVVHRKREHGALFWCAAIVPNATNGLTKASTADAAQTRALDTVRFEARLGKVTPDELEAITTALCLSIGREPVPISKPPAPGATP